MPVAGEGMIMTLHEAQTLLTDNKGEPLEFKQQKDGTWKADDVDGDEDAKGNVKYVYQYSLTPQTPMVIVSVSKILKEDLEKEKEEKAAPSTTTSAPAKTQQKTKSY